jgi:biotin operon repressor
MYIDGMEKYKTFAAYLKRNNGKPPKRVLAKSEQYTIAIYKVLQDHQWHSAAAIASKLNLCSVRYIRNILQAIKAPLNIESSRQGYRLK